TSSILSSTHCSTVRSEDLLKTLRSIACIAAVGFVTACQPAAAPPPPPPPPPTAIPQAPASLHVSYSNIIADNLPEWVALESGIFKQHGLDVQLDNIASSTGIPALLSG